MIREIIILEKMKYIYYKEDDMVVGYLEQYPDYMTQGKAIEELEENLIDIYKEVSSGTIPFVRRMAELKIA
ncbi:MAG: type II toxin-antitoxin system HicB family antitoxin [Nitrospirota bacterium]